METLSRLLPSPDPVTDQASRQGAGKTLSGEDSQNTYLDASTEEEEHSSSTVTTFSDSLERSIT